MEETSEKIKIVSTIHSVGFESTRLSSGDSNKHVCRPSDFESHKTFTNIFYQLFVLVGHGHVFCTPIIRLDLISVYDTNMNFRRHPAAWLQGCIYARPQSGQRTSNPVTRNPRPTNEVLHL